MAKKNNKISTDGSSASLANNPFGSLNLGNLPVQPAPTSIVKGDSKPLNKKKSRGRLDVGRQKAGRGGKTVTVITGFKGIANEEKLELAKTIQKRCGVGGAVKGGNIEVQGDKREEAQSVLEDAGFKVVFVGG